MLMLNTIAKEQPFTLQTDEYLPFKLDFQPPLTSVDEIYYWRSMNSRYLLEVGLAVATGAVNTITRGTYRVASLHLTLIAIKAGLLIEMKRR